jgi:serine/threonine protein kinase
MRLGPYRILLKLGEGGMSYVYLAEAERPESLGRLVVLKCLKAHLAQDGMMRDAFRREAELGVRLRHPGIVQTYEYFEADGMPSIVLEYLEGLTYGDLAWRRTLPLRLHITILRQLVRALLYLHEAEDADGQPLRVVHRDISPQNLFVTYDGAVKLLDFGIAKSALGGGAATAPGVFRGRLHYAPPEQAGGEATDCRADLFAVGVMLWEAWTGRRMWEGLPEHVILEHLIAGRIPDYPPDRVPSSEWQQLLSTAVAALPDQRFSSARELAVAMDQVVSTSNDQLASPDELSAFLIEHYDDWRDCRQQSLQEQKEQDGSGREAPCAPVLPEPTLSRLDAETGPVIHEAAERPLRSARLRVWWLAAGALALGGAALTGLFLWRTRSVPAGTEPRARSVVAGSVLAHLTSTEPNAVAESQGDLPPAAPCTEPFVLADFEDGTARPCRGPDRNGTTYFYWDGTGTTNPKPGLLHEASLLPEPRGASRFGIHLTGSALRDWGAGIAILLHDKQPVDLSQYRGVALWARSDIPSTSISIKLATPATLDESYGGRCRPHGELSCDDHYAGIRTVASTWTRLRVAFDEVQQGGWGVATEWDPKNVVELHVSVIPSPAGTTDFDLWLDDLRLY